MDEEITQPTSPSSLGAELRQAREQKGISFREISNQTKIRELYLQALEDDNYAIFPSRAYFLGFLRNYAKCVGLEIEPLIRKYNTTINVSVNTKDEIGILDRLAKQKPPKTKAKAASNSKLWIAVILLLSALVIAVGIFNLWGKLDLTKLRELPGRAKDSALAIYKKPSPKLTPSATPKIEKSITQNESANGTKTNLAPGVLPQEKRPDIPQTSNDIELKGDTLRLSGTATGSCWVILKKFMVDENGEEKLSEYISDMILREGISKQWTLTDKSEVIEVVIQKPQFVQIEFNQKPFQLPAGTVDPITLRMEKGSLAIK